MLVKEDFKAFLYCCFKYLGLGEPTEKQYAMADLLQHGPNELILMAGRGDGKSVLNACYVGWLVFKDPNITVLVLSATTPRALKFISQVRKLFDVVPFLESMKPKKGEDKDNAYGFNVTSRTKHGQDWTVTAKGLQAQVTGSHADVIVVDDGEILENSDSLPAIERLYERFLEIENVKNEDCPNPIIRILGTYQSTSSVYLRLSYPTFKFPSVMPDLKDEEECYNVHPYILGLDLQPMQSTQPERFSDEVMLSKLAKLGPKLFSLHHKLNPTLSDRDKYPLKLADLIVLDVDKNSFPQQIVWGRNKINKLVQSYGLAGDYIYDPQYISAEYSKYIETIAVIDPSGRGKDETAICVASSVNGYIVIHYLDGFEGGYDKTTLKKLCGVIADYPAIRTIHVEDNFGDGMFAQLLMPELIAFGLSVGIEPYYSKGKKEKRCIDRIEPVSSTHRLVFNTKAIQSEENQKQYTRITEKTGSLLRDDRIDCLSRVAEVFSKDMVLTPEQSIAKSHEQEIKDSVKQWAGPRRILGILPKHVSGALVVNGRSVESILKPKRTVFDNLRQRK